MKVVRVITYEGDEDLVAEQMKKCTKDGVHMINGCRVTVETTEGKGHEPFGSVRFGREPIEATRPHLPSCTGGKYGNICSCDDDDGGTVNFGKSC